MSTLACGYTFIRNHVRRLARDASGATAIEYAIIASGVSVAIASVIYNLGSTLNGLYSSVAALF
jgi:pilus assembly protein Flp/PilA